MQPTTIYEHTDIPAGMTCSEYRRLINQRARSPRHSRGRRLLRRLRSL